MTTMSRMTVENDQLKPLITFQMEMQKAPSDDPIAYCYGFMNGYAGDSLVQKGEKKKDMAKAYIDGHTHGCNVKSGKMPMPAWATLTG